jgi:serpin B
MRWAGLVAAAVATAMVAAMVAACGGEAPAKDPDLPTVLRAENVARAMPSGTAPVSTVAAGMAQLGLRLGQAGTGNWVVSPASIAYAFAMVRGGARGATADEIDTAFGFPPSGLPEAFNAITRAVVTADVPPPPDRNPRKPGEVRPTAMCVSDAVFPAAGYPIGADFLRTLAEQFGAGVYPVDFTKDAASRAVDAWVKQQTAGRITKLFDRLPNDTKLVLANTVYLRADWKVPFDHLSTSDEPFRRSDSSTVTARTMHASGPVRYAEGPGWQAVELPYVGGQLAMRILLPAPGGDPNALLTVNPTFATRAVQVSLPAWDFGTDVDLKAALGVLGVRTAFDPSAADFSGINPQLFIDQAVHRATITVDEAGTEAAAATGIAMAEMSAMPQPSVSFTADHPYAFAIVHTGTGVPLFVGHVADPTAHA